MPPTDCCLVYVSASESREIHVFSLDLGTGALDLLEVIAVPGSGAPTRGNTPLAVSLDHKHLYAHVRVDPYPLSSFSIDPASGRLRLLESIPLAAPMAYLSITRNGKFLLAASYDDASLSVHSIRPDGRVERPAQQILKTPPKAHCILEAPFDGLVYATSVDGHSILAYRLDEASGRLEALAATPVRAGTGPRHLVFHPRIDVLYCINEHAGSVATYSIDRVTGTLGELQYESLMPPGFSGRAMGADIHLNPDGSFIYATVRETDSTYAFRVDPASGLISRAGQFEIESYPRGFAIDPAGRYLLAAGQKSGRVSVFAMDQETGGLALIGRHSAGKRPSWVEILPTEAIHRQ